MDTYEKKYKEIVGLIKKAYLYAQTDSTKAVLEEIFPELKESEDERIIKGLIKTVSRTFEGNKLFGTDVTREEALAWLEKQEGCEHIKKEWLEHIKQSWYKEGFIDGKYSCGTSKEWTINDTTTLNELIDFLENGTAKLQHDLTRYANWLKIQLAPNVEPKFHEGEWIVDKSGFTQQVLDFRAGIYTCTYNSFTIDCESNYHLWTIQDAKDGDVLALKNDTTHTLICMSPTTCDTGSYCRLRNGFFIKNKEYGWASALLTPATKEQRDLLFQKMHEAGYMWDSESKQLLSLKAEPSVEQESSWSEEDKD